MFRFQDPLYLILLIIIPVIIYLKVFHKKNLFNSVMSFSSVELFKRVKAKSSFWKKHSVLIILLLSYIFFIIALARPQTGDDYINLQSEGIDIVLVIDLSGSMRFVDGIPKELSSTKENSLTNIYIDRNKQLKNRLDIAKKIIIEFVEKRKQDRMGLVVFSDYPYTESPITINHDIIIEKIKNLDFTLITGQATAIGDAIVSGTNKLIHSISKSKIIILFTDGNSNKGEDPIAMSEIAAEEGIKIYCIGIGGTKEVLRPKTSSMYSNRDWAIYEEVPMKDGERLDEQTLKRIAENTGGKYFQGSNEEELRNIYNEIDTLEKSKQEYENIYIDYKEHFLIFLLIGAILLILAFLLENTILRILP